VYVRSIKSKTEIKVGVKLKIGTSVVCVKLGSDVEGINWPVNSALSKTSLAEFQTMVTYFYRFQVVNVFTLTSVAIGVI